MADIPSSKPVRIYSDGVYDLFHYGHARQLEQCKKLLGNVHLIVGVCGQEDVEKYKGPTVLNGEQRAEGVKHCKWVDEVVYPAPWVVDEDFLNQHRIDYVAHDDIPYVTAGIEDAYATCKKLGKFKATQRTEGISTSDIINLILKDRQNYYMRNIRRGYTRQQLGIGLIEFYKLKLQSIFSCPKKEKKE